MSFQALRGLFNPLNGETMSSTLTDNSAPPNTGRRVDTSIPGSNSSSMDYIGADGRTEGFDEFFDPPVPPVYECPICLMCLRDPVQTTCGHRFCRGCIMKVIKEGRPNCPVDNEHLDEKSVFPDNFAKREIAQLKVHCRNYKAKGCDWLGALKNLEEHMQECPYQEVECENKCGESLERRHLEKHLKDDCSRRVVSCNYCSLKVVFELLEEHSAKCEKYPVMCPNACTSQPMPREKLVEHLEFECPRAVVKCPFTEINCTFEGERDKLKEHIDKSMNQHLTQLIAKVKKNSESVEVKVTPIRNLQNAGTPQLLQKIVELETEVNKLKESLTEAKEKADQARSLAEMYYQTLKANQTETGHEIQKLSDKWDIHDAILGELQAKVWRGKFVWRVGNFEQLFQQAMSGEVPAIHSLPFYSGIPGYKMCLRVNLYGVDSGASTHVSMFIHLMQGDFDSLVDWPFPGRIVLTVIDQSEAEQHHVSETLISRPGLQAFLRPRTPRNHKGYGYVEMISHPTLRTRGYVKNNTMVIQVEIVLDN